MNIPDEVKKKIEEESAEKYADVNYNDLDEYKTLWEHLKTAHLAGWQAHAESVRPRGDDERDAREYTEKCGLECLSSRFQETKFGECVYHRRDCNIYDAFLAGRKSRVPASEAVPGGGSVSDNDERDAEDARKAKGYKDSENFYDPYLDTAIVERKKSDAFRDGFLAGRKGMVSEFEVERRVAEAVGNAQDECARAADQRVVEAIRLERERCAELVRRNSGDRNWIEDRILSPRSDDAEKQK